MKKFFTTLGVIALLAPTVALFTSGASSAVFAAQTLDSTFLPKGLPTLSGNREEGSISADQARIQLTQRIVNVVMGTAGVAATFVIVLSGFTLVVSAGSDDVLGKAKKSITWALVGLVALIVSYSVIRYVIEVSLITDDPNSDRSGVSEEQRNQQEAINDQRERDILQGNSSNAEVDSAMNNLPTPSGVSEEAPTGGSSGEAPSPPSVEDILDRRENDGGQDMSGQV